MNDLLRNVLAGFHWTDAADVLIVAVFLYWIMVLIKGTRAVQMLVGLAVVLGLYAVALVSGLTDVDAITLSSLRLFGQEKLAATAATTAILLAVLANLCFKFGIVVSVAGRALAMRVLGGFAAFAAGCIGGWLIAA